MEIQSVEDEEKIVKLSREKKVVVKTSDWTIIPLENLLARTNNIFVEVKTLDEARTALGILEKGVDGLVIQNRDPMKVRKIIGEIRSSRERLELTELEITGVRPAGMGDRVCVDTCTMMKEGEGLLVGNSSRSLFLIHSESIENPYVAPRPFRVNAGPVHAYVMVGNTRSERVLERAHFTREGCLRSFRVSRGQPRDFWLYSILRPEWEEGKRVADQGQGPGDLQENRR